MILRLEAQIVQLWDEYQDMISRAKILSVQGKYAEQAMLMIQADEVLALRSIVRKDLERLLNIPKPDEYRIRKYH